MQPRERILARLASGDADPVIEDVADPGWVHRRDLAMIKLGALLALDACTPSLQRVVCDAELEGVTHDEIVGCAVALLPMLGSARMSAVTPHLALALGYDLQAATGNR